MSSSQPPLGSCASKDRGIYDYVFDSPYLPEGNRVSLPPARRSRVLWLPAVLPATMQNLETDQNEKKETKLSVTGDEYFCTCSWSCSFCQYNIYGARW